MADTGMDQSVAEWLARFREDSRGAPGCEPHRRRQIIELVQRTAAGPDRPSIGDLQRLSDEQLSHDAYPRDVHIMRWWLGYPPGHPRTAAVWLAENYPRIRKYGAAKGVATRAVIAIMNDCLDPMLSEADLLARAADEWLRLPNFGGKAYGLLTSIMHGDDPRDDDPQAIMWATRAA